jgi:proteic killer suppression protein
VKITKFIHKGLKNLYEEDVTKGVPQVAVDKLQKMLSFLEQMGEPEELRSLASWKAHTLTGDRKGVWSLSVTGNLRLTFFIDLHRREIRDVDLEDYH